MNSDNTESYKSGIYDKLKLLGNLASIRLEWYTLEYMHEFWMDILHNVVDKLILEVTKFCALYGRFKGEFVVHGDDHATSRTAMYITCDVCKRGVMLLNLVHELDDVLYVFVYQSGDTFKKKMRNLRKKVGEQVKDE